MTSSVRKTHRPLLTAWRQIEIHDLRRLVCALVLVAVTLIAATSLIPLNPQAPDPGALKGPVDGAGNMLRQALYLACMIATLLSTRPLAFPSRIVALPPRLLLLFAFCAISLTWSIAPMVGARRLILVVMLYWIAYRNVQELGFRAAMWVMTVTFVGTLLADWAAVIITPNAVHTGYDAADGSIAGDWRGIFPHKNDTGPVTVFTIFYLIFWPGTIKRIVRWALIAAAVFFLIKTGSKTSMALVLVGLSVGGGYLLYNPAYRMLLVPVITIIVAIATVVSILYLPGYFAWLETRPDAFTGRVPIWQTMLAFISDHPLTGAGFGSFWDSGPVSLSNQYSRGWVATMVTQGHNGYLDLWTQIGLPGAVFAVGMLVIVPMAKLLVPTGIDKRLGAITIASLAFLFGHNFTESTMLMRDFFGNFMLAFTIACVDSLTRAARLAAIHRPQPDPAPPRLHSRHRAASGGR